MKFTQMTEMHTNGFCREKFKPVGVRKYLCVLLADVLESVPVTVAQSCRTLEAHVAELLLSLARLQSVERTNERTILASEQNNLPMAGYQ